MMLNHKLYKFQVIMSYCSYVIGVYLGALIIKYFAHHSIEWSAVLLVMSVFFIFSILCRKDESKS